MNISRLNLQLMISTILTGISYLVGGFDSMFKYLVIVILLDYITGVLSAIYEKRVNSKIGLKGIAKKVGYLVLIALCTITDYILKANGSIRILAITLLISCDGISIIENLAKMNIPIPKKIKNVLEQIKKE